MYAPTDVDDNGLLSLQLRKLFLYLASDLEYIIFTGLCLCGKTFLTVKVNLVL